MDAALGEGSSSHEEYDYYAQDVSVETAILPSGWRERLVSFQNKSTGKARPMCLDPHDLAASKLAARREKDLEFVEALVKRGLLSRETLVERLDQLETTVAAIRRRAREQSESIGRT